MDDTTAPRTTATTTSAAAMADSGSTKIGTPAGGGGAGGAALAQQQHTTPNNSTTSVKLLIKASNQQHDDQTIESDLLWTVKRLKTQLSLVYPSKPPVADQKLIYSGQLLNDALQIKDVIRSYKDVYTQNHIIHLVCTPKNTPVPKLNDKPASNPAGATNSSMGSANHNSTTVTGQATPGADGLRQRHIGIDNLSQQQQEQQHQHFAQQWAPFYQQQQQQYNNIPQMMAAAVARAQTVQCPNIPYNGSTSSINPAAAAATATVPFSFPGQFNMQAMASQQAAMYHWMQQMYTQYMDQYARLSAGLPTPPTANATNGIGAAPPHSFMPPMHFAQPAAVVRNIPVISSTPIGVNSNSSIHAATPVGEEAATLAAAASNANENTGASEQQPGAVVAAPAEQQPEQQPAAAVRRFPNIVQEEEEHRDWLETFFLMTRLAIFLTILYFNSSPLRLLTVVVIASSIYLYHIGVLRFRRERNNNNNINRDNNAAAADQIRQGVQQVQQAQAAEQQQHGDDNLPNVLATDADISNGAATDEATAVAAAAGNDGDVLIPNAGAGATASAPTSVVPVAATEDNTSVISVVRTFVVTFFTSLLPETPVL